MNSNLPPSLGGQRLHKVDGALFPLGLNSSDWAPGAQASEKYDSGHFFPNKPCCLTALVKPSQAGKTEHICVEA